MTAPHARYVDVRATRFAGALTTIGAAGALATAPFAPAVALGLTTALTVVLLAGALGGPGWNLWAHTHRALVAPHLAPARPHQREPAAPPRFANLLGGVFLAAAVAAQLGGATWLAAVLVTVVAALAALNATTGLCVGCRFYGLLVLRPRMRAVLGKTPP